MKKAQYAQARAAEKKLIDLQKRTEALRAEHRQVVAEHQLVTVNCDHKLPNGKTAVKMEECVLGCKHRCCRICKLEIGRQPKHGGEMPVGIPMPNQMPAGLMQMLSMMGLPAGVQVAKVGEIILPGKKSKASKKSAAKAGDPSRN
jgi:hypothetical protein